MKPSRYWLDASRVKADVDALPGNVRQRIKQVIGALRDNPYPPEAQAMRDEWVEHWRIQVGDWRIVYRVYENVLIIEIVGVGRKSGPDRGPTFCQGLRPRK